MNILGYTISLKTAVILFILYSIILLNMTWSCCLSPAIESMQNPNLQQLVKANIKKNNPYN
jgi:hypothetical protein